MIPDIKLSNYRDTPDFVSVAQFRNYLRRWSKSLLPGHSVVVLKHKGKEVQRMPIAQFVESFPDNLGLPTGADYEIHMVTKRFWGGYYFYSRKHPRGIYYDFVPE